MVAMCVCLNYACGWAGRAVDMQGNDLDRSKGSVEGVGVQCPPPPSLVEFPPPPSVSSPPLPLLRIIFLPWGGYGMVV